MTQGNTRNTSVFSRIARSSSQEHNMHVNIASAVKTISKFNRPRCLCSKSWGNAFVVVRSQKVRPKHHTWLMAVNMLGGADQ